MFIYYVKENGVISKMKVFSHFKDPAKTSSRSSWWKKGQKNKVYFALNIYRYSDYNCNKSYDLKGKICNWKLFFFHQKMSILLNSALFICVLSFKRVFYGDYCTINSWQLFCWRYIYIRYCSLREPKTIRFPPPLQTSESFRGNQIVPESC